MEPCKQTKTQIEPLDMEAYQNKKCKWSLDGKNKADDPHFHAQL